MPDDTVWIMGGDGREHPVGRFDFDAQRRIRETPPKPAFDPEGNLLAILDNYRRTVDAARADDTRTERWKSAQMLAARDQAKEDLRAHDAATERTLAELRDAAALKPQRLSAEGEAAKSNALARLQLLAEVGEPEAFEATVRELLTDPKTASEGTMQAVSEFAPLLAQKAQRASMVAPRMTGQVSAHTRWGAAAETARTVATEARMARRNTAEIVASNALSAFEEATKRALVLRHSHREFLEAEGRLPIQGLTNR